MTSPTDAQIEAVAELYRTMKLVARGFANGHLKDQTIIRTTRATGEKTMTPLSELVDAAILAYELSKKEP